MAVLRAVFSVMEAGMRLCVRGRARGVVGVRVVSWEVGLDGEAFARAARRPMMRRLGSF